MIFINLAKICCVRIEDISCIQKRYIGDEINPYRINIILKNREEIEVPYENGKVERDLEWDKLVQELEQNSI